MVDRGVDVVVAEAHVRFRSSARFDDELRCEVTVTHMGTTSIVTRHLIKRDDELLVEVEIRHVMVEAEALGKTPIPAWVREGLAPWSEAAPASA
jgi:acyl-CoA thioester hydrolase